MLSSRVRSFIVAAALLACTGVVPAHAKQLVRHIPFPDWLAAQGTSIVAWQARTSSQPNAPVANIGVVDYAGGRAQANGLSFGFAATGSVTVRELPDGTGEVLVNADFANAITWARDVNQALIFGYLPPDLAGNPSLSPGLSSGHLQAKYIVPDAGFPELNLANVALFGIGGILEALKFSSDGSGPLRAAFGVPDGTPGQVTIAQTGLFTTGGGGATADGFPVEHVDVKLAGAALRTVDPQLSTSASSLNSESAPIHSWGELKTRYRDGRADERK